MTTVNPLPSSAMPGTTVDGDAHQQRWLRDLERAWLRSWQQAEPAGGAAAPRAEPAPPRPVHDGPSPSAVSGLVGGSRSAPGVAATYPTADIPDPLRATPGFAGSPVRRTIGDALPAAPAEHAQLVDQGTSPLTAWPVAPSLRAESQSAPNAPRVTRTPPAMPASPPVSTASLHLREPGADGVMAALRDSQLDAAASRVAAESLARQLALAGYAQVQVYVNGTPVRRQASETQQPPSAVHREEKPPHGH